MKDPRNQVINKLKEIVQLSYCNNQITIEPYGSYQTGLLTPFSDVDLAIQGCQTIGAAEGIKMLELLEHNLKLTTFVKKTNLILSSSIPVLKIECESDLLEKQSKLNSIKIDIIVNLNEELNVENTAFRTTKYISQSIETFRSFFVNMLLLKLILSNSGYSNSYTG